MSYARCLQQQLRESYAYEYVVYSTERYGTCDMYSSSSSSSSCDGAAHGLSTLLYYVRYVPRAFSTTAGAAVAFYATTLWTIACVRFLPSVNKRTLQHPFRSKLRERCAHTSHLSPSAFYLSLENHQGFWRCVSFPTFESFPQQTCVYVFPTFISCLRVVLEYSDFSA